MSWIKGTFTDDKTGQPSSTRQAGFIALFALIGFCVASVVKPETPAVVIITLGSVVTSLLLAKVVKDVSKQTPKRKNEFEGESG